MPITSIGENFKKPCKKSDRAKIKIVLKRECLECKRWERTKIQAVLNVMLTAAAMAPCSAACTTGLDCTRLNTIVTNITTNEQGMEDAISANKAPPVRLRIQPTATQNAKKFDPGVKREIAKLKANSSSVIHFKRRMIS